MQRLEHNQHLCERLGIQVWAPRIALKGSVGPHWVVAEQAKRQEPVAAAAPSIAPSLRARGPVADSGPEVLRAPVNKPAQVTKPKAVQASNAAVAALAAKPMECLCLFFKNWLFIDDVTLFSYRRSAYLDWQFSLLRAIGFGRLPAGEKGSQQVLEESELPLRRIRWPSANDLDQHLARSNNYAARDLTLHTEEAKLQFTLGWLRRQQASLGREIENIVLLGDAPRLLAHENRPDEQAAGGSSLFSVSPAQGELKVLFGDASVLCAPSSELIWASADNKNLLWRHLQSMIQSS